jgi:hypothetical protein
MDFILKLLQHAVLISGMPIFFIKGCLLLYKDMDLKTPCPYGNVGIIK